MQWHHAIECKKLLTGRPRQIFTFHTLVNRIFSDGYYSQTRLHILQPARARLNTPFDNQVLPGARRLQRRLGQRLLA
jgi:hypothetical protein